MDDLDELAGQCQKILNTEYSDKLDELYQLGWNKWWCSSKDYDEYQGKIGSLNFRLMWMEKI